MCLLLSIRLAHASLEHKLAARKKAEELRLKQLADEAAAEQEVGPTERLQIGDTVKPRKFRLRFFETLAYSK